MTDPVKAAMEAARANAANVIVEDAEIVQQTLPATADTVAVTLSKPSMANMVGTGGIAGAVDVWLKIDEFGFSFGTDKKKITDDIKGHILMVEGEGFMPKSSIKWGNPVQYASSYDGVVSDKGTPWAAQIQQVQRVDPKARPFNSADIIFVLGEDLQLKDSKLEAGTKIGITLAMSNWRDFETFYKEVVAASLLGTSVPTVLTPQEVKGKNGYTWGTVGFSIA